MMEQFLDTIMNGDDGVIRKIEIFSDGRASIIISAMMGRLDNWVNVAFHLEGLREFTVKQSLNCTNAVLSDGIAYMCKDNIHYIDFSPYSELMETEEDFRMSEVYFASDKISYEILPYRENY